MCSEDPKAGALTSNRCSENQHDGLGFSHTPYLHTKWHSPYDLPCPIWLLWNQLCPNVQWSVVPAGGQLRNATELPSPSISESTPEHVWRGALLADASQAIKESCSQGFCWHQPWHQALSPHLELCGEPAMAIPGHSCSGGARLGVSKPHGSDQPLRTQGDVFRRLLRVDLAGKAHV